MSTGLHRSKNYPQMLLERETTSVNRLNRVTWPNSSALMHMHNVQINAIAPKVMLLTKIGALMSTYSHAQKLIGGQGYTTHSNLLIWAVLALTWLAASLGGIQSNSRVVTHL